jgi:hypothetical protein
VGLRPRVPSGPGTKWTAGGSVGKAVGFYFFNPVWVLKLGVFGNWIL